MSDRGIAIALGTAMQESWLRNLDWGDRDSLGLFQQRPSTGWGTAAEVTDPGYATRVFFGGASDPNGYDTRGLLDIPGWESMSFADAAQAVGSWWQATLLFVALVAVLAWPIAHVVLGRETTRWFATTLRGVVPLSRRS